MGVRRRAHPLLQPLCRRRPPARLRRGLLGGALRQHRRRPRIRPRRRAHPAGLRLAEPARRAERLAARPRQRLYRFPRPYRPEFQRRRCRRRRPLRRPLLDLRARSGDHRAGLWRDPGRARASAGLRHGLLRPPAADRRRWLPDLSGSRERELPGRCAAVRHQWRPGRGRPLPAHRDGRSPAHRRGHAVGAGGVRLLPRAAQRTDAAAERARPAPGARRAQGRQRSRRGVRIPARPCPGLSRRPRRSGGARPSHPRLYSRPLGGLTAEAVRRRARGPAGAGEGHLRPLARGRAPGRRAADLGLPRSRRAPGDPLHLARHPRHRRLRQGARSRRHHANHRSDHRLADRRDRSAATRTPALLDRVAAAAPRFRPWFDVDPMAIVAERACTLLGVTFSPAPEPG